MVQLVNTRGCQFQLTSYGDKGAGLVALVDIQPGTLLISEPAILRVTLINGDLSSGASKDVNRQFSSMESEDRKLVMSLANNYTDYTNEVLAIFKTNAMTISPMEAGLYPWVCRANHSCSPNCNYYHNSDLGLQQLFCVRHIRAGEEITVSYLPDNMFAARSQRRAFLLKTHNFVCQCSICSLEGEELALNEGLRINASRRVAEINVLASQIPPSIGESDLKRKYKYCCLNLLNQLETMAIPLPTIYMVKTVVFSIYIMLGDKDTAMIWCQDLVKLSSTLSGEHSEETVGWKNTCGWIKDYFTDLDQLQDAVQGWSLII